VVPLPSPSVTAASTWGGFLPGSNLWVPACRVFPPCRTAHLSPRKVIVRPFTSSGGDFLPSITTEVNRHVPWIWARTFLSASPPGRATPAKPATARTASACLMVSPPSTGAGTRGHLSGGGRQGHHLLTNAVRRP